MENLVQISNFKKYLPEYYVKIFRQIFYLANLCNRCRTIQLFLSLFHLRNLQRYILNTFLRTAANAVVLCDIYLYRLTYHSITLVSYPRLISVV